MVQSCLLVQPTQLMPSTHSSETTTSTTTWHSSHLSKLASWILQFSVSGSLGLWSFAHPKKKVCHLFWSPLWMLYPPPLHQTRHNQDTKTQMPDHLQRRRSQEGRTTTPEQSVQVQWIPDRIHTQSHQQKDTRTTWSTTKHKNLHLLH